MEKITFSANSPTGFETVRSIVLKKLKTAGWNQFPNNFHAYFKDSVELEGDKRAAEKRFLILVNEVFWQLITQGIISPGFDPANPELPFFHITDHGKRALEEGDVFIPHDPTEYLREFSKTVVNQDDVVVEYLKESLRCFTTGCFLASTMMLGIAAERTFLILCAALLDSLNDPKEQKDFKKIYENISMVAKTKWVEDKLEAVTKSDRGALPQNTITHLSGILHFLRVQRNDIGHPQDNLQIPHRDDVYVYLRLFPQYCLTVEKVKEYLSQNKV
jgi:hypothetical protein